MLIFLNSFHTLLFNFQKIALVVLRFSFLGILWGTWEFNPMTTQDFQLAEIDGPWPRCGIWNCSYRYTLLALVFAVSPALYSALFPSLYSGLYPALFLALSLALSLTLYPAVSPFVVPSLQPSVVPFFLYPSLAPSSISTSIANSISRSMTTPFFGTFVCFVLAISHPSIFAFQNESCREWESGVGEWVKRGWGRGVS